jgi:copper chaperone CopZ
MKILALVLVSAFASTVFAQDTKTDTLSVKGMSCTMCERRIEKNIKKLTGIKAIEADSENEIAVVTFDPAQTSKGAIEKEISRIGYDAGNYPADKTARENLPGCCNPNAKH